MDISKPQPQRFDTYTLLPGGKAFTIKDCKFVFKLDKYGGWRDQNGHYYNSNGQPDFQPQDAQILSDYESGEDDNQPLDDFDQYEPQGQDDQEEYASSSFNSWEVRNLQKTHKNIEILSVYSSAKPLRIYFSNMPFKQLPKTVYQAYSKRVNGIVNIIFDTENNRRNGQGHFIMSDKNTAETLVKLEGVKVLDRDVHFEVQPLDDLVVDPIKEKDLVPFWNPIASIFKKEDKKDDIPRFKAAQIPQPKTQQTSKKPEPKKEQPKKEETKKEEPKSKQQTQNKQPQFQKYRLNFQIFSNKTKFFTWIQQNNINKETDIQNINKEEKNGQTVITMEVKKSVIEKLKGKTYEGKQVVFTLV